ncbi:hypothetical protein KL942_005307 [Ogataea angusta]|uniref:FAD dependent oxidoreductase domain-containing protein n=1 Tax=Pichia angusta TaxID=870730 RepID=A0ABQ7RPM4_PICAN|nr:hypothetical protein KL942_005307 [Ogataea angusta]KAG7845528.1 hypothetical protein KL940_005214 [Ogataea angusta]
MTSPNSSVLIVGAGTFGLSTALQLLRKGHKNVTLLDPYAIPSPLAAGNDINKIFQSTVSDEFYSELALEALELWRSDPVYQPAFHEVGIVYGATGDAAVAEINQRYSRLDSKGEDIQKLETPGDFAKLIQWKGDLADDLKSLDLESSFKNWKGYFQKNKCGWTFAALALNNAWKECKEKGAHFFRDAAEELLIQGPNCVGVRTYSGAILKADRVVICAGANSTKLLNYRGQLLAKCWTVGHIKLTSDEAKALKHSPVLLNLDEGFLFEPDENGILKFCNEFPGYINQDGTENISGPLYRDQIPVEAEKQMRGFLKQVFPQISTRPFDAAKICWCTDTPDRHFLICEHPDMNGLILATGDSGQGFKYMPIIGHYISELVMKGDSGLPEVHRKAWRWRPETAEGRDIYNLQGRFGGSNRVKDLSELSDWTN